LDDGTVSAEIVVAGVPALVAIDASGERVAIADFDRAVRVWDFQTAQLLGQFDLPAQPGVITLSADGSTLGAVYPNVGLSFWDVANPQRPLLQEIGSGLWQLAFSPSGNLIAAGRPQTGFQIYNSDDGRLIGPPLGVRSPVQAEDFLTFSDDEKVLLLGSADTQPRIWSVPAASFAGNVVSQSSTHTIWSPAADRVIAAAPDGAFIAIGDPAGHVHIISSDATLADIAVLSEDVSFVGHTDEVRIISVAATGLLAGSVAADNTLRVWRTDSGEPLPYVVDIAGPPVSQIAFSPDTSFVGILSGNRVSVVAVADGKIVADYDAAYAYSGLTFAADNLLYLGDENGALQLLSRGDDGNWHLQQVWQGPEGISKLHASPQGDSLILVDRRNLARQFFLSEAKIGDGTLQLPSNVHEIVFDKNGSRAFFRTARWVHRANSSISGLIWVDALFVPRPLRGVGIVHGNGLSSAGAARKMYLPVTRNGYIELAELSINGFATAGLFGNKEDLLREWRERISAVHHEGS
jgi:hypothetical protein